MRNGFRVVTVMLWLGCVIGLSVSAFAQSATGSLRGTITDTKDLVIADATLTLADASLRSSCAISCDSLTRAPNRNSIRRTKPSAGAISVTRRIGSKSSLTW